MLLILLAGIVYGCIFAYKVKQNGGGLSGVLKTAVGHNEETKKNLKSINVLVLGESGVAPFFASKAEMFRTPGSPFIVIIHLSSLFIIVRAVEILLLVLW